MDLASVTKVLLKITGIYFFALALMVMPAVVLGTHDRHMFLNALFSCSVWGVLGLALFLFPGAIANHVIRIKGDLAPDAANQPAWVDAGVRLIGCYFAFSALGRVTYDLAIATIFNNGIGSFVYDPSYKSNLASSIVALLVGILLWVFGNPMERIEKGLTRFFRKPASEEAS
jgi:hypothetical protein